MLARNLLPVPLLLLCSARIQVAAQGAEGVESCLRSSSTCVASRSCAGASFADDRSCLAAAVPWGTPYKAVRCCFRCCLDYWYRRLGLMEVHEHWRRQRSEHGVPNKLGVDKHGFPDWDEVAMSHMTPFVWAGMRGLSSIFDNPTTRGGNKQDVASPFLPNSFAMFEGGSYPSYPNLQDRSSKTWPAVVVIGSDKMLDRDNANGRIKQWFTSNPQMTKHPGSGDECLMTSPELRHGQKKFNIAAWLQNHQACIPENYYNASSAAAHLHDSLVAFPRAAQTTSGKTAAN